MVIKIYVHETPLLITDYIVSQSSTAEIWAPGPDDMPRMLDRCRRILEGKYPYSALIVATPDPEKYRDKLFSEMKVLKAGGGVVFNEDEEILAIFRRGSWDLPKGKIDKGETIEDAAVREVQEETGLKNVELEDFLIETFHIYIDKKHGMAVKWSFWYTMNTSETKLVPQKEEDIEQAIWISPEDLLAKDKIYGNIVDVINSL